MLKCKIWLVVFSRFSGVGQLENNASKTIILLIRSNAPNVYRFIKLETETGLALLVLLELKKDKNVQLFVKLHSLLCHVAA